MKSTIVGSEQIDIVKGLTQYVLGGLAGLDCVRYGVVNECLHNSIIDVVYYPEDIRVSTVVLAYIYIRCGNGLSIVVLEDNHPVDALLSSRSFELADPGVLDALNGGLRVIYDDFVSGTLAGHLAEVDSWSNVREEDGCG